jgi:hypothetical protein
VVLVLARPTRRRVLLAVLAVAAVLVGTIFVGFAKGGSFFGELGFSFGVESVETLAAKAGVIVRLGRSRSDLDEET